LYQFIISFIKNGIKNKSAIINVFIISSFDVEFKKVDMRKLPFEDNSFDAVVSMWAIETLPSPKTAVKEFLE
jgi:ubiquinone/menaquinone biosynthesis C-methylase UbiE